MNKKSALLIGAAISGLLVVGGNCKSGDKAAAVSMDTGKCHGINECKAKGACGAKDGSHTCAGKNSCKGKGWLKMSKEDCDAKGGEFQA